MKSEHRHGIALILIFLGHLFFPGLLGAFPRREDPVTIQCCDLKRLYGVPIGRIRVFSDKGRGLEAIPFQIDKKNVEGSFVLDEKEETEDRLLRIDRFEEKEKGLEGIELEETRMAAYHKEDMEIMDGNDELVFMAWDLGARTPPEEWPAGADMGHEIEVTDPHTGVRGYAYALAFDDPPPYSDVDYISYDPREEILESRVCRVSFRPDKPLIIKGFWDKDRRGTLIGGNVIDRFKSRLTIKPKFFFTLHFDEEGIESRTVAYKDGPIRVIRRNEYWLELLFLRVTPKVRTDYIFYANHLAAPIQVDLTFDPADFFDEGSLLVAGMDHAPAALGAKVYTRDNPEPFTMDGHMSQRERRLSTINQDWFVVLRESFGVVGKIELGAELRDRGITPDLRYIDDLTRVEEPETYPGSLFLGYEIDLVRFPKGRSNLMLYLFYSSSFERGDERKFLDILENPLEVRVK